MRYVILSVAALAVVLAVFIVLRRLRANREIPIAMGRGGSDDGPTLSLTLSNIREKQQISDQPPHVVPGGAWTVFDCAAVSDPSLRFTVAVEVPNRTGSTPDRPFAFSKAVLIVPDRQTGSRMVQQFALTFGDTAPPEKSAQPLKPLRMGTAYLGDSLRRNDGGAFTPGPNGSWTATKWFLQNDGYDAEVFFNYDLRAGRAEFTEKDPDYAEDLVAALAAAVRDGPRPPRTPENDPNLTTDGPGVVDLRPIPDTKECGFEFTRDGKLVLTRSKFRNSVAWLLDPASPETRVELGRVEGQFGKLLLLDPEGVRFIAEEHLQAEENTFSPSDPRKLWAFDRSKGQKQQLSGPWGDDGIMSENALSPDGKYLVIEHFSGVGADRRSETNVLELETGKVVRADLTQQAEVVNWTGAGDSLRALVLTGDRWEKDTPRVPYLVDPRSGTLSPAPAGQAWVSGDGTGRSPDGRYTFKLHPHKKVELTESQSRQLRTFVFHEDDRRQAEEGSLSWVSPRYIEFGSMVGQTLIDARSLKMSILSPPGAPNIRFSPDFRWAVTSSNEGLSIGRISAD